MLTMTLEARTTALQHANMTSASGWTSIRNAKPDRKGRRSSRMLQHISCYKNSIRVSSLLFCMHSGAEGICSG